MKRITLAALAAAVLLLILAALPARHAAPDPRAAPQRAAAGSCKPAAPEDPAPVRISAGAVKTAAPDPSPVPAPVRAALVSVPVRRAPDR